MGPWWGWIAGWAIVVADIIVMANLAEIAGLYTYLLFGWDDPSTFAIVSLGVVWIAIMTTITTIGIELSARTQRFLLGAELITLALFAVVALVKVYGGDALAGSAGQLSWFSPFAIDGGSGALVAGVLIGVFIYWGWDSLVTVNEETEDSENVPGRAAIMSTLILVGIYVLVSVAAVAFGGAEFLAKNADAEDALGALGTSVLGDPWDKLVIIAVLTSAAASTQTTILPTARTTLSMAVEEGAAGLPRQGAPALPDPPHLDDTHGSRVGGLVRRPQDREREHPVRLDHRARPDDRLLLRAHGLRLRALLPGQFMAGAGRSSRSASASSCSWLTSCSSSRRSPSGSSRWGCSCSACPSWSEC